MALLDLSLFHGVTKDCIEMSCLPTKRHILELKNLSRMSKYLDTILLCILDLHIPVPGFSKLENLELEFYQTMHKKSAPHYDIYAVFRCLYQIYLNKSHS